jgi:succinyl-diaminopimelate desuccinylase
MTVDPIDLTAQLIRCPSVTPKEAGALALLEATLARAGFECTRVDRNETSNLFARWGKRGAEKTLGFNGHTDVVPEGAVSDWTHDPFGAVIEDGIMWGRGTTDMKSGVACFVAAAVDFVTSPRGEDASDDTAIIIAITGDEEGPATDGTVALLEWMDQQGEQMSHCLVGEPTCPNTMGEMMKIGRRGSVTAYFTARGTQGHVAYPHRAQNPIPALAKLMDQLADHTLDQGTSHFDASTLAVTTFDTGNPVTNLIPAACSATVNIRFNDAHTGGSLLEWLAAKARKLSEQTGVEIEMTSTISGESFVTQPGAFVDMISEAVEAETGLVPELSTSGGTSDARFVKNHCPVVEFGLVGKTMHQVDEHVPVSQIKSLKSIYARLIGAYFA